MANERNKSDANPQGTQQSTTGRPSGEKAYEQTNQRGDRSGGSPNQGRMPGSAGTPDNDVDGGFAQGVEEEEPFTQRGGRPGGAPGRNQPEIEGGTGSRGGSGRMPSGQTGAPDDDR